MYFLEEFEDGDTYACDITGNWYTDYDSDDDEFLLYIDVFGIDDDDDYDYDDDEEYTSHECPKCGYTGITYQYSWDLHIYKCKCLNCGFRYASET